MDDVRRIDAPREEVRDFREREELKLIERSIIVPTNDDDVRRQLRAYNQNVELPNESKESRRRRLKVYLAKISKDTRKPVNIESNQEPESPDSHISTTTVGKNQLFQVREAINEYVSSVRSNNRHQIKPSVGLLSLYGSQSGFGRAVSSARFIKTQSTTPIVIAADWTGAISAISLDDEMTKLRSIVIPDLGILSGLSVSNDLFSIGTAVGKLPLLRYTGDELQCISILSGHKERVSQVDFHPNQNLILSASYDSTWKLWDINTSECVLCQDGHTEQLTSINVNPEGSIAATGGYDMSVKLWDLRSGIPIISSNDHTKTVHCISWKNDWEYASAGADNTCVIRDLRNTKTYIERVYAHNGTISDIRYTNDYLVTCSFDGTIKYWSSKDNWLKQNKINLGSRIMCIDFSSDMSNLIAGKWDRTLDWCK